MPFSLNKQTYLLNFNYTTKKFNLQHIFDDESALYKEKKMEFLTVKDEIEMLNWEIMRNEKDSALLNINFDEEINDLKYEKEILRFKLKFLKTYLDKEFRLRRAINLVLYKFIRELPSLEAVQMFEMSDHWIFKADMKYVKRVLYQYHIISREINKIDRFKYDLNKHFFNNAIYNFNVLDIEECDESHSVEFLDLAYNQANVRTLKKEKKFIHSSIISFPKTRYVEPDPKPRNIFLLTKIRVLIDTFRNLRSKFSAFRYDFVSSSASSAVYNATTTHLRQLYDEIGTECIEMEVFDHQMEEPGSHGEGNVELNKKSNVVLSESRVSSSEQTAEASLDWSNYCSSEIDSAFTNITDRWIQFSTFEWNVSDDGILEEYSLPYDAIVSSNELACSVPNTAPFTFHRYWKGDMEIKVQVNSNKFQIGSLQVAWLYESDYDDNLKMRKNVYSLSQTHHCLISASASNEGCLLIPYKNHLPLLHTKKRTDMPKPLHAGRLFISVLNPLATTDTGPRKCYVTVFIRFINSVFTGMLNGDIDKLDHQMDILGNVAMGLLNTVSADSNRDNPPDNQPPNYLVPTASHSWSIGTGISEPLHSIRLDGRGQTPHPLGLERMSEMSVQEITSKFGLLTVLEWDRNASEGDMLFSCDAAPMVEKNMYSRVDPNTSKNLAVFRIPPIGVVSSMFMGWRGTIEFRFDIIASAFHTGRLMCGYVPGATKTTNMSLKLLRSSTNIVFTLQEQQQFSFLVPYIANKPFWFRTQSGDYNPEDPLAPSRLYLTVLNRLIPMESVPPKVYINVYMRAGPDFELIVPVQPALGLGFNTEFIAASDKPTIITALEGYAPYYCGVFEDLVYAQCLRWGTLSHQIAHFTGQNYYDSTTSQVSYCQLSSPKSTLTYTDNDNVSHPITFCVFIYLDQLGYIIGVPVTSEENAQKLSCLLFKKRKPLNDLSVKEYVVQTQWSTSNNGYSTGNPLWNVKTYTCPTIFDHQGERDSASTVMSVGGLEPTQSGRLLYGESFFSLKDLCRRYQYYGCYFIPEIDATKLEKTVFSFPLLPQGLDLQIKTGTNVNQLLNRCRDGHIPIIASGYRYYRGGLRFRIVLDPKVQVGINVQHRPDKRVNRCVVTPTSSVMNGNNIFNHTYGSYLQLTSVNGVVEFEIPFYLFGMYGLLQRPKLSDTDEMNFFSLGNINVNLIADANEVKILKNSMVSIYYCVADDMHFSTFQGFPPMVYCNSVPPDTITSHALNDFEIIDHQMFKWASNKFKTGISNAVLESVRENGSQYLDVLDECVKKYDSALHNSYMKIGLELLHMISDNCSIKSVCFAIVKILLEVKFIVITDIMQLVNLLSVSMRGWLSRSSSELLSEDSTVPDVLDHQSLVETFDPKLWVPLLGMFYVGTTTAMNVVCDKPRNISSYGNFFVKNLPTNIKGGSFIISFLYSCIDVVKMFVCYVVKKVYPVESWYYSMNMDLPEITKWCDEVFYLDSLDLSQVLDTDGSLYDRIYYVFLMGRKLLLRNLEEHNKEVHLLLKVVEKSQKLYEKMVALGKHPFIRREPYSVWMVGKPGIGKSFLTEYITSHMLKKIRYRLKGPKMFTIMPMGEFWTGCKNQPVLNMDDAFSVNTPTALEKDLNIMYMVKSPVALNPPMANLEDKNLRYNPEIFWCNSNIEFPSGNFNEQAIARRSDIRIKAQVIDAARPLAADYSVQERKDFGHLEFFIANRPSERDTAWQGFDTTRGYTMNELCDIVCNQYECFYKQEIENYEFRIQTYDIIGQGHLNQDDLEHFEDLSSCVITEYERKRLQYKRDLDNSLYNKVSCKFGHIYSASKDYFKSFFSDNEHQANDPMINRFLLDLLCLYPNWDESIVKESSIDVVNLLIQYDIESYADVTNYLLKTDQVDVLEAWKVFLHHLGHQDALDRPTLSPILVDESIHERRSNLELIPEGRILDRAPIGINLDKCEWNGENVLLSTVIIDSLTLHRRDPFRMSLVESDLAWYKDKLHKCYISKEKAVLLREFLSNCEFNNELSFLKRKPWQIWLYLMQFYIKNFGKCIHCEDLYKWDVIEKKWRGTDDVIDDKICGSECVYKRYGFLVLFNHYSIRRDIVSNQLYLENKYYNLCKFFRPNVIIRLKDSIVALWERVKEGFKVWFNKLSPGAITFLKTVGYITGFVVSVFSILTGVGLACNYFGFNLGFFGNIASNITAAVTGVTIGNKIQNSIPTSESMVHIEEVPTVVVHEGAYNLPRQVIRTPTVPKIIPQSDQNYNNNMRKLNRNFCTITCTYTSKNGTEYIIRARCLGIANNAILGIKHYHDEFIEAPPDATFVINLYGVSVTCANELTFNYKDCKVDTYDSSKEGYTSSFYILYLPANIPPFKNIINMFAPLKSLSFVSRECDLYAFGEGMYKSLPIGIGHNMYVRSRGYQKESMLHTCFVYNKSAPGLCGSILLDKRLEGPIIGMHVAGGSASGVADVLYREFFDHLLRKKIVDIQLPTVLHEVSEKKICTGEVDFVCEQAMVDLESCLMKYGVVENQMAHRETGKTQYVPSVIHGVFPVQTEPNPLTANDKRLPPNSSPMKKGCEKHGMPVLNFNKKNLDAVKVDMMRTMRERCKPVRSEVSLVSLQDAICGNKNIPHFESLEWTTSPGYGFTHIRPKNASGKKWLFNLKETTEGFKLLGIKPELSKVMKEKMEMREKGIVPCTIFVDCLKDTCLSSDKCREPGKTRIFSISPVDFTIQFKQFFGDFLAAYTNARFEVESAIGMDVTSNEWNELAILLQRKGNKIISGDYKNFGPGLNMDVVKLAFDVIIDWYQFHGASEKYVDILTILAAEIMNSWHLCFNLVYRVFSGIPSGSPITTILNNMVNSCYIRLMWLDIFEKKTYHSLYYYHQFLKVVCYGDDIIINVSDDVAEEFNCVTLSNNFAKYKIVFTNFDKTNNLIKYDNLINTSFLSGTFVAHPKRPFVYLYGLKKISLEGCVNWVKTKNQSNKVATLVNCNNSIMYAYGWGPEYFESVSTKICDALRKANMKFVCKTWDDFEYSMFELNESIDVSANVFIDYD